MLKHLVLSVDYTADWELAVSQLPVLIKRLGTEKLTLMYIIETHKRQHMEDNEGSVAGKLKAMAEELATRLGVVADYKVGRGFVASKILELAKLAHADGVIACNCSHSRGRELFLGNNAMNLARMTLLPLLILPVDGSPATDYAPVLLATDGSDTSSRATACFEELVGNGSEGLVVWVRPEEDSEQVDGVDHQVHELANRYSNVHAEILGGHPAEGILETIHNTKPVLTVLGKRGNTPIPDILLGSVSQRVVRNSNSPVLLIP